MDDSDEEKISLADPRVHSEEQTGIVMRKTTSLDEVVLSQSQKWVQETMQASEYGNCSVSIKKIHPRSQPIGLTSQSSSQRPQNHVTSTHYHHETSRVSTLR